MPKKKVYFFFCKRQQGYRPEGELEELELIDYLPGVGFTIRFIWKSCIIKSHKVNTLTMIPQGDVARFIKEGFSRVGCDQIHPLSCN